MTKRIDGVSTKIICDLFLVSAAHPSCVLVEQDLNSDGQAERILFAFNDDRVIVYGFDSDRKEWDALDMSLLPNEITKEKLLTAAKDGKLGTRPKAWRDLTVDGETLEINLSK